MPDWLVVLLFLCTAPLWLPLAIALLGMVGVFIGGAVYIVFETIATAWRGR